ncbi:hypothetical protein AQUCO_03700044v1 [Aquilegia coerulea]|uniref:Uncharacterized protein n=1 Tax=Aquilegia coerulea TaxID=218851 RepID=A0A2G5CUC3_AQUCA|nr:hypothetical protein AQUCO_03700044v1 [Aquilegia coerulea]
MGVERHLAIGRKIHMKRSASMHPVFVPFLIAVSVGQPNKGLSTSAANIGPLQDASSITAHFQLVSLSWSHTCFSRRR